MTADSFQLEKSVVHLWLLSLDPSPAVMTRLSRVISPEESLRASRFVHETHRTHFVAAHGLLRIVLAGYVGLPPWEIEFEKGSKGKPSLRRPRGPRFSLSHAGACGLVAVCLDREVGVDLEPVRDFDDLDGLTETCLSPAERAVLASLPEPYRCRAFLAAWTRKEALPKAAGEALSRCPASVDVSLAAGQPERQLRVQEGAACHVQEALAPAPGYVGALAVEGGHFGIRHRTWNTLSGLVTGHLMLKALV